MKTYVLTIFLILFIFSGIFAEDDFDISPYETYVDDLELSREDIILGLEAEIFQIEEELEEAERNLEPSDDLIQIQQDLENLEEQLLLAIHSENEEFVVIFNEEIEVTRDRLFEMQTNYVEELQNEYQYLISIRDGLNEDEKIIVNQDIDWIENKILFLQHAGLDDLQYEYFDYFNSYGNNLTTTEIETTSQEFTGILGTMSNIYNFLIGN